MEKTGKRGMMNRGTYEALRKVGASEEQAIVLASAIPDIEPLRSELRWIKWSVVVMIAFLSVNITLAGFLLATVR